MIRRRAKLAIAEKVAAQIIQYNLTQDTTYDQYLKIVSDPIGKRVLEKDFSGRWLRLISTVLRYHPHVFRDAEAAHKQKEVVAEKPKEKKPLSGLEALKKSSANTGVENGKDI